MNDPVNTDGWTTFDAGDWPITLRYPATTPGGCPVRIDEHVRETGHRFHFVSDGSDEIYFEIGRYPDFFVDRAMAVFIEEVTGRIQGVVVGEAEPVDVAGRQATRFEIRWPGKRRLIHFLNVDGITHRVILDPDSELNLVMLDGLRCG